VPLLELRRVSPGSTCAIAACGPHESRCPAARPTCRAAPEIPRLPGHELLQGSLVPLVPIRDLTAVARRRTQERSREAKHLHQVCGRADRVRSADKPCIPPRTALAQGRALPCPADPRRRGHTPRRRGESCLSLRYELGFPGQRHRPRPGQVAVRIHRQVERRRDAEDAHQGRGVCRPIGEADAGRAADLGGRLLVPPAGEGAAITWSVVVAGCFLTGGG